MTLVLEAPARSHRLSYPMASSRLWGPTKIPEWNVDRFFELFQTVQERTGFAKRLAVEIIGVKNEPIDGADDAGISERRRLAKIKVDEVLQFSKWRAEIGDAVSDLKLMSYPQFDAVVAEQYVRALSKSYSGADARVDECYRMLMYQIDKISAKRNWIRSLDKEKIDHQEAACEVLERIVKKFPRLSRKIEHACPLVLIQYIQVMIERELISVVRRSKRKTIVKAHQAPEDYDYHDPRSHAASIEGLESRLIDLEPEICGNNGIKLAAYQYMREKVIRGELIPTYAEMPEGVSDILSADDHADLSIDLNKAVHAYAADHGA